MATASEATPLLKRNRRDNDTDELKSKKGFITAFSLVVMMIMGLVYNIRPAPIAFEQAESPEIVTTVSVRYDHIADAFEVTRGYMASDLSAKGKFHANVDGAGWNFLEVEAMPHDSSLEGYLHSMRAMGYIEGYLTWKEISEYYPNYFQAMFDSPNPEPQDPEPRILQFVRDNFAWMDEKSREKCDESDHWLTVRGVIVQLEGMLEGFIRGRQEGRSRGLLLPEDEPVQSLSDQQLTSLFAPVLTHFMLLNSNGDLYEIMEKFAAEDSKHAEGENILLSADERDGKLRHALMTSSRRMDHCSALLKLLPDGSDIAFGHNTWDDFRNAAPRIFKHYTFPAWPEELQPQGEKPNICACAPFKPHMYFSSSPGMLTSVDDFYTAYTSPLRGSTACACSENAEGNAGGGGGVGGRLVVMETSLDVHKASLYDLITPTSLLSWVRVRSANLMARDGAEWSRRFSYDHSGTYANQWMVLDMARFQPASGEQAAQLSDGLLTIVEEMPGMISGSDQTTHLQSTSYWASYNQVFDEELSAYSGSTEFCETTRAEYQERIASGEVPRHDIRTYGDLPGELNCYHTSSRANLFAGLQGSVESVFDLRAVLDYNHFQQDKESVGDSCESLSCREDLQLSKLKRRVFGAIDGKASSLLRADIYRPGTDSKHAPGVPEIFVRQGPTTQTQKPFCWSDFEVVQNDFFTKLKEKVGGSISDYLDALRRGEVGLTVDDDSEGVDDSESDDESASAGGEHLEGGSGAADRSLRLRDGGDRDHMKESRRSRGGKRRRGTKPSIVYSHKGHPDCFDYDWVVLPPRD